MEIFWGVLQFAGGAIAFAISVVAASIILWLVMVVLGHGWGYGSTCGRIIACRQKGVGAKVKTPDEQWIEGTIESAHRNSE